MHDFIFYGVPIFMLLAGAFIGFLAGSIRKPESS